MNDLTASKLDAADFADALADHLNDVTIDIYGKPYWILVAGEDSYEQKLFIEVLPIDDAEEQVEFSITVRKKRRRSDAGS